MVIKPEKDKNGNYCIHLSNRSEYIITRIDGSDDNDDYFVDLKIEDVENRKSIIIPLQTNRFKEEHILLDIFSALTALYNAPHV